LKQGDSLSLLLFNFALEYAIGRFQENQDGLKLNGTHKRLVDAEDVNVLGGSVHAVKKNTEELLVGSEEIGLQVNADKTKYMVMSRDQNLERSHNILTNNSSFQKVEEFRYLGTTLTNQNYIQEEIESRPKLGNFCHHSVQNLLFSRLLFKNTKIKVYRTVLLPVVLYECETWSLTLREERS